MGRTLRAITTVETREEFLESFRLKESSPELDSAVQTLVLYLDLLLTPTITVKLKRNAPRHKEDS